MAQDEDSVIGDWVHTMLHQLAGVAQGALDVTAWILVAGLLWQAAPPPKAPVAPGPMVVTSCSADCIETVALASGS